MDIINILVLTDFEAGLERVTTKPAEDANCDARYTPNERGLERCFGTEGYWRMDRVCKGCQRPFKAIKPNQKFCSQRCARKASGWRLE